MHKSPYTAHGIYFFVFQILMIGLYHRKEIKNKLMEIGKTLCCCSESNCNKSVQSTDDELQHEQRELLDRNQEILVPRNEEGDSEDTV